MLATIHEPLTIRFPISGPPMLVNKGFFRDFQTDCKKPDMMRYRVIATSDGGRTYLRMVCRISWFFLAKSLSSGRNGRNASGCCRFVTSRLTNTSYINIVVEGKNMKSTYWHSSPPGLWLLRRHSNILSLKYFCSHRPRCSNLGVHNFTPLSDPQWQYVFQ